ncbi:MAG: DNA-3-methyladenine glycosylase [Ignavibacteria bacterium]|nr:DNA-3-methyladenine glycosylase [Ignavibacteria bacterium]MBT8391345.1 DNA-3-methyladenine glycosylase [Ignavibacteria bacterium]NNJ53015.1 DNA-3-methyladenine glycosylase [Ignavibacteriaceae bacterium]NNL21470.1 DNA-3-methyladenine glycosylase [Ignavibacteriaceae bacterium]
MTDFQSNKKLSRAFYKREVTVVAKDLLGKILLKNNRKYPLAGKIVEVEAYHGDFDEAAHSFKGRTKRTEVMFKEGGYLYVYFTYGAHFCCNVVTGKNGQGTAVLIRAIEPLVNFDIMINNRFGRKLRNENEIINLTSGPGKLCKAFNIDKSLSGIDLLGDKIFIIDNKKLKEKAIGISKRIGITRSIDLPWRFFIKDNPFLSRK